jgi:hypothetical protein
MRHISNKFTMPYRAASSAAAAMQVRKITHLHLHQQQLLLGLRHSL